MAKAPRYDRRKYPRVRTETLVAVARVDSSDHLGWSVDLSQGGIRFQWVGLELEVGEGVRMTLDLGGHQGSLVGKVARVTALDAFAQEVALAFHEADAKTVELLKDYLEDGELSIAGAVDLGSTPPAPTAMRRAAEQAQRLGSELRRLALVKRAEDRGKRAVRRSLRWLLRPLDRLPIATRGRVAAIHRRTTELTRRVRRLEKGREQ